MRLEAAFPLAERLTDRPEEIRLGQLLADYRKAAGLDQVTVAERLGMSQAAVSKLERGLRSVAVFELVDLCDLYGADVADIIYRARYGA